MSVDETGSHDELEPGDSGSGDATSSMPESVDLTQKQGPGNSETQNCEETGDEQGERSSGDIHGASAAQAVNTDASNTSEDTGRRLCQIIGPQVNFVKYFDVIFDDYSSFSY